MTAPPATHEAKESLDSPVSLARLWVGVLAAPVAWVSLELVGYYLASSGCESLTAGAGQATLLSPRAAQAVLDAVALVAGATGLGVAISNWRALGSSTRDATTPERGRARFMATVGILASVLFLGGMLLFGLAPFIVNICREVR